MNGLKPFASPTGLDSRVSAALLAAVALPFATAGAALAAATTTEAPNCEDAGGGLE